VSSEAARLEEIAARMLCPLALTHLRAED